MTEKAPTDPMQPGTSTEGQSRTIVPVPKKEKKKVKKTSRKSQGKPR